MPHSSRPHAPTVVRPPAGVVDLTDSRGTASRHALVVGTEDWSIAAGIEQLEACGWVTHRCQDSLERTLPCRALDPAAGCPLDRVPVTVVVSVRGRPSTGVGNGEMGAICGVRAGTPLVLAGYVQGSGLLGVGTTVTDGESLSAACEQAAGIAHDA